MEGRSLIKTFDSLKINKNKLFDQIKSLGNLEIITNNNLEMVISNMETIDTSINHYNFRNGNDRGFYQ